MTDTATLLPQGPQSDPYVDDLYTLSWYPSALGPEYYDSGFLTFSNPTHGPEHPLVDSSYPITQELLNSVTAQYHVNSTPDVLSNNSPQSSNPYIAQV